jgi:bifunctional non-homologous end joining protein LigD
MGPVLALRAAALDCESDVCSTVTSKAKSTPNRQTWDLNDRAVDVTSRDRVLWPDDGFTKLDMLSYYAETAQIMLRYLAGHPVTLNVFPRGINEQGYYRRRMPDNAPDWIDSIEYQAESRSDTSRVPVVQSAADLIWFANQGGIEFHMWASHGKDLEHPRWAIFDLDPGEKASFRSVCTAALEVRSIIESDGLESFCKTSGARGMHVFVPLEPKHEMERAREWVRHVAQRAKEANKRLIESRGAETHSGSKVTVDDAQNSIARNTAAPYSLRALSGASVSARVTWDEVEAGKVKPDDFNIRTIPERLEELGDIWEPAVKLKQRLSTDT